jgi:uncharacterized membrane protein
MKNRKSILFVLGFVLLSAIAATPADAPNLTFKFSKVNVPGAFGIVPLGVNNKGVIVGSYYDKKFATHGFMLNGKKLTTLDDPKGTNTGCDKLNSNDAIVGFYTNSSGYLEGFLYKDGKFTDIPGPAGALSSFATGINDAEDIVGTYVDSVQQAQHGFLLRGTAYTTLDVPNALLTVANRINDKATIVLEWVDSNFNFESSLTRNNGKTYKTIDVPGATGSEAIDLDNVGDVVYQWLDSSNNSHGALLHSGKYYKFDFPNSVETSVGGINDHRLIVGEYKATTGGPWRGFKATYK